MRKRWVWILTILLCAALLAFATGCGAKADRYSLTMHLSGDAVMAIEIGQTFDDPGAQAQGHDSRRGTTDVAVACEGQVDNRTPGVYRLTYRAEYQGNVSTAYRDVHVVESLAPTITLVSDPDAYTLPNTVYQEEGFRATDWHDGDITHLVQRTEGDGVVVYTVTNSAGLTTTVQRVITYNDPVAPELTLLGDAEMTVTAGKPYAEPGYQATDNVDGDLTQLVQVTGEVDAYRPGTYLLTYTVTDSWGNTATVQRSILVELPQNDPTASTGKIIYLTFDDGPGPDTGRLLDILAKYNVKASFFLVNTGAIGIATRIADEGHTVAIHTATHNFAKIYASEEAYFADLYRMQSIIEELTGQTTYLIRFPGGSSNTISANYNKGIMTRLVREVRARGFRYFDWNVDSNDAGGATTADEVFNNVINGIQGKKTAIVLQHDVHSFSVDAVERIIVWGLANGYTFLPLTEDSPSCAHGTYN